jgi:hypothetical protein
MTTRVAQARGLIRLCVLAKLRKTYPTLDLTNCTDVVATVFKSLGNHVQWEDDDGERIAMDEPAIHDALLSELQMILFANLNQLPTQSYPLANTQRRSCQPVDKKKAPAEAGAVPRSNSSGSDCSALRQDNTYEVEVAQDALHDFAALSGFTEGLAFMAGHLPPNS